MTDKHFDAILAKNAIARAAAKGFGAEYILARLEEIEMYIGQANQPTARDMFMEAQKEGGSL